MFGHMKAEPILTLRPASSLEEAIRILIRATDGAQPVRWLIASKDEINNDHRDRPVATYFAQRRNETGLRCSRLVLSRIHISVSSPFACYHLGQMTAETDRSQPEDKNCECQQCRMGSRFSRDRWWRIMLFDVAEN